LIQIDLDLSSKKVKVEKKKTSELKKEAIRKEEVLTGKRLIRENDYRYRSLFLYSPRVKVSIRERERAKNRKKIKFD
jgi:hypothetical protein